MGIKINGDNATNGVIFKTSPTATPVVPKVVKFGTNWDPAIAVYCKPEEYDIEGSTGEHISSADIARTSNHFGLSVTSLSLTDGSYTLNYGDIISYNISATLNYVLEIWEGSTLIVDNAPSYQRSFILGLEGGSRLRILAKPSPEIYDILVGGTGEIRVSGGNRHTQTYILTINNSHSFPIYICGVYSTDSRASLFDPYFIDGEYEIVNGQSSKTLNASKYMGTPSPIYIPGFTIRIYFYQNASLTGQKYYIDIIIPDYRAS